MEPPEKLTPEEKEEADIFFADFCLDFGHRGWTVGMINRRPDLVLRAILAHPKHTSGFFQNFPILRERAEWTTPLLAPAHLARCSPHTLIELASTFPESRIPLFQEIYLNLHTIKEDPKIPFRDQLPAPKAIEFFRRIPKADPLPLFHLLTRGLNQQQDILELVAIAFKNNFQSTMLAAALWFLKTSDLSSLKVILERKYIPLEEVERGFLNEITPWMEDFAITKGNIHPVGRTAILERVNVTLHFLVHFQNQIGFIREWDLRIATFGSSAQKLKFTQLFPDMGECACWNDLTVEGIMER